MNINRIIWIVLDSVGIGEARDAAKFGDEGADTLGHTAEANGGLDIPNMVKLGIGNIDGAHNLESCDNPIGCFGKLAEVSAGKDTTIGHWEMAGIYSPDPFPVYPDGFPDCIIDEFIKK
jgi:phosphopentomutase